MEQTVFRGIAEGLEIDHVIRDSEYSMVTRHFHGTYEMYYLLEGQRYYFIETQTYLVKAGDIVMIQPNRIHKTSMAEESYHSRILLQIDRELMNPLLKVCGLGSMEEIFNEDVEVLSVPEGAREEIAALFGQIYQEIETKPGKYMAGVKLKLAEVFLRLMRYRKRNEFWQENQKAQTWKHRKVHEVADYLLHYPETGESLEALAKRFYISKSYLSRIFREVTGFTVNEFKNVSRIKKSQQLLVHSDCSITEISDVLGFENLTYYERVFKKYSGMTPLKYRKSTRM